MLSLLGGSQHCLTIGGGRGVYVPFLVMIGGVLLNGILFKRAYLSGIQANFCSNKVVSVKLSL